jgi:hypothetical protein
MAGLAPSFRVQRRRVSLAARCNWRWRVAQLLHMEFLLASWRNNGQEHCRLELFLCWRLYLTALQRRDGSGQLQYDWHVPPANAHQRIVNQLWGGRVLELRQERDRRGREDRGSSGARARGC